jgi:hypothetical protein
MSQGVPGVAPVADVRAARTGVRLASIEMPPCIAAAISAPAPSWPGCAVLSSQRLDIPAVRRVSFLLAVTRDHFGRTSAESPRTTRS